jgi:transposase
LLFIREDFWGRKVPRKKPSKSKELYIDEVDQSILDEMQKDNIVGIDPNLSDLIYSTDSNNITFRYTRWQRNFETKKRYFAGVTEDARRRTIVEEHSIMEWETMLSAFNSNTVNIANFTDYVIAKLYINQKVREFYNRLFLREFTLHRFRNKKNTEYRLIKNFREKFGENPVIAFGDWEQKQHRKFKEPVKGKGFRKMFRQAGFTKLYLIDEFRTSQRCWGCKERNGILSTFRYDKRGRNLVHGLLKCGTCNKLWNRDANASRNIRDIAICAINGEERPMYLCRPPRTAS